ncbi:MAG TPA: hypothetical protein VLA92_04295 [Candidatus Saccharimonadales bacterium]|nr:hypothetical protein [Candidatus Saccharimonadales bacterium]
MFHELTKAVNVYETNWKTLVAGRANREFFETFVPTAVGWKTIDQTDFDKRFAELRELSDQIHLGWVNNRWLATFHLKDTSLPMNIRLVKLMQRRPSSEDATGLDHVDFAFRPERSSLKERLAEEPSLKWDEETNGDHCKWISIWFADTEAKVRSDTVLDVCAAEMKDLEKEILS